MMPERMAGRLAGESALSGAEILDRPRLNQQIRFLTG